MNAKQRRGARRLARALVGHEIRTRPWRLDKAPAWMPVLDADRSGCVKVGYQLHGGLVADWIPLCRVHRIKGIS
jgi:hypothetical protein